MLSDGSSTSTTLVLAAAARAASTDPSGVVGWLPAAAALGGWGVSSAMAVTCGGEFGVDHAETVAARAQ